MGVGWGIGEVEGRGGGGTYSLANALRSAGEGYSSSKVVAAEAAAFSWEGMMVLVVVVVVVVVVVLSGILRVSAHLLPLPISGHCTYRFLQCWWIVVRVLLARQKSFEGVRREVKAWLCARG